MGDSGICQVCQKVSTFRCGFCRITYYCGKEHQKKDWKKHKPLCTKRKFEVHKNETLGRHLIASEEIKSDQILLKDKPLILGPKLGVSIEPENPTTSLYCLSCFKELIEPDSDEIPEPECMNCGLPICSDFCSNQYYHKNYECRFFHEAKTKKNESEELKEDLEREEEKKEEESMKLYNKVTVIQSLLYFRCILMKYYFKEDFITLISLESNIENREDFPNLEKTARIYEDFKKILKQVNHPYITEFKKPELHEIMGIIGTNGIEIQISENFNLIGIYPLFSLIEHSCYPNTKYYFIPKIRSTDKDIIEVYVRSSMKIENGIHISICYTNLLWNTEKRREDLKRRKYFLCNCIRCIDPTELGSNFSTIRCPLTDCMGYALPINFIHWECEKCKKIIENWQVEKVDKKLGEMISKLKPDIINYREMIEAMEVLVHPNYYLNFLVNHSLIQIFGKDIKTKNSKEILDEKIKICNQLLVILKIINPGFGVVHIYAGVIYYEMQSAILGLVGGEGEDDFKILRNHPESVKLGKIYLQKCIDCFFHEFYDLPENKLKILAEKKMEYLNMIIKHIRK